MKLSLVTPCLDPGPVLAEAVASVQSQSGAEIDYLVADAGSRDGTVELLRSLGPGLRWTSRPDAGPAEALAEAFAPAESEALGWLGADDRLEPGAAARAVQVLDQTGAVLVYGNAELVDSAGQSLGPGRHVGPFEPGILLHERVSIAQPAAFFRKDAYLAAGGLDPALRYGFDWDLWLRLARRGRVVHVPEVWARVGVSSRTLTATGGTGRLAELERIALAHGRPRLPSAFYGEAHVAWRRSAGQALVERDWRGLRRALGPLARYTLLYSGQRLGWPVS